MKLPGRVLQGKVKCGQESKDVGNVVVFLCTLTHMSNDFKPRQNMDKLALRALRAL